MTAPSEKAQKMIRELAEARYPHTATTEAALSEYIGELERDRDRLDWLTVEYKPVTPLEKINAA